MHQTCLFVPGEYAIDELREQFDLIEDSAPSAEVNDRLLGICDAVVQQFPLKESNWYKVFDVWLPDLVDSGGDVPGRLVPVRDGEGGPPAQVRAVSRKEAISWVVDVVRSHLFFAADRVKFEGTFSPDDTPDKDGPWPTVQQLVQDPRGCYELGLRLLREAAEKFIQGQVDIPSAVRRLARLATFVDRLEHGPFSYATPYEHCCFSYDGAPSWERLDKLPGLILVDVHT